jgi:glycosyltransferase involved in cell wall biosynthesis
LKKQTQGLESSTRRIGIYSPYFGVLGGGELYLGTIAEALSAQFEVDLISESEIPLSRLEEFFGLNLSRCRSRRIPPIPFVESLAPAFPIRMFQYFQRTSFTRDYDLFILMPRNFRIPFRVLATKKILHLQVPERSRKVNEMAAQFFRGRWTNFRNEIVKRLWYPHRYRNFDAVLINSQFHARVISERLKNPRMLVLPPPVQLKNPEAWAGKQKEILSVGRFFTGLHSKRQDILIRSFRVISANAEGWHLNLAGGVAEDQACVQYYQELQEMAANLPVTFYPNVPLAKLNELYQRASFYWHAAGYGVPQDQPERMEHFGITTVEAMSAGCVPFVYRAGGQMEIIEEGMDGIFWETEGELIDKTLKAIELADAMEEISKAAVEKSRKYGKERFINQVQSLIESL